MEVLNQIKKIIKQSGGKDKAAELNLSGIKIGRFTPEITALLQECKSLQNLILSDCDLESLQGMPKLNLEGIDLTGNKLTDADIKHLKMYSKLYHLLLTDNNIQNVESLKGFADCKDLVEIDISGNPVADAADYRKSVFEWVKELNVLDGKDVDGNEVPQQQEFDGQDDDDDEQFSGDDDDDQQYEDDEQSQEVKPKKNQKKGGK